jgi:hypothetical protein
VHTDAPNGSTVGRGPGPATRTLSPSPNAANGAIRATRREAGIRGFGCGAGGGASVSVAPLRRWTRPHTRSKLRALGRRAHGVAHRSCRRGTDEQVEKRLVVMLGVNSSYWDVAVQLPAASGDRRPVRLQIRIGCRRTVVAIVGLGCVSSRTRSPPREPSNSTIGAYAHSATEGRMLAIRRKAPAWPRTRRR